MLDPELIQRQRTALHDLQRFAAERAAAERTAETEFRTRTDAAESCFEEDSRRLLADSRARHEAQTEEFARVRQEIAERHKAEYRPVRRQFSRTRFETAEWYKDARQKAEDDSKEARWTAATVLEADRAKAKAHYQKIKRRLRGHLEKIEAMRQEATQYLERWITPAAEEAPKPLRKEPVAPDALRQLKQQLVEVDDEFYFAKSLVLVRFLKGKGFFLLFLLAWVGAAYFAVWKNNYEQWFYWAVGVSGGMGVLGLLVYAGLHALAKSQVHRVYHPLCTALADIETLCEQCRQQVAASARRQFAQARERYRAERKSARDKYHGDMKALIAKRESALRKAQEQYRLATAEIKGRRDSARGQANQKYPRLLAEGKECYEQDAAATHARRESELEAARTRFDAAWQALVSAWHGGLEQVYAEIDAINAESRRLFPPWDDPIWKSWKPPAVAPPVVRFGGFEVRLADIPEALPAKEDLKPRVPLDFSLPALAGFPEGASLLFEVPDEGRAPAEAAVQAVMFRLLTAVPPSKIRFTIIDPIGLGKNYAAFMHLADHDEALVTSRIWTEKAHIEQRLADLTAHMETVIQKFLRNQFRTIEEYNTQAGEVAEPFRVLVVANFPAAFSPEAMQRLVSIAASGARCGVLTLVTVDQSQPLPHDFDLAELERHAVVLNWHGGRFHWTDADFGRFPFTLDAPPDPDFMTRVLQEVGRLAKLASRVEVPFEFIAPPAERWWRADSRSGIDVALGRAGATKRQHLQLGQGTSQHVLIAGKTGSGKSTLLHALITNLALTYSPDEVELYLIDFKEGVEFKSYATNELPHARVVAIESEREFGLSVLQRLEAEMKRRGDLFRATGVQDVNGYRQASGTPLPRILLIIDEFQLFFIDDDKIAQDAALLLDRLVRQGRAFGIHVLLGSQTLGGAYSLARSTIGQMAVRIALQCSESDANLILSDDNPAARLLSRPGEAIYNDANGLVEGNDFFQVVWLSEDRREQYLRRIHALADQRHFAPSAPQIIFEGNAPADIHKNQLLTDLLEAPTWPTQVLAAPAWLGEAMAIKDPTAATFRPQSGSNLLVVGQFDDAARSIVATMLVSLAAQHAPGTRFYILDGTPVDAVHAGYLAQLAGIVPQALKVGGWRDVPATLGEIAGDVERRQKDPDDRSPPMYLFIYGLQRFRDLRPQEDDFSFSRRNDDQPPSPSKLLATVLREGPGVGVHTTIWCDSLNNVNRGIERPLLREFEMRVLFQMSAADSSNLIDSPAAGRLGLHRALFHSEDRGQPEKFRPYGLPEAKWLEWVKERLAGKRATIPPDGAATAEVSAKGAT